MPPPAPLASIVFIPSTNNNNNTTNSDEYSVIFEHVVVINFHVSERLVSVWYAILFVTCTEEVQWHSFSLKFISVAHRVSKLVCSSSISKILPSTFKGLDSSLSWFRGICHKCPELRHDQHGHFGPKGLLPFCIPPRIMLIPISKHLNDYRVFKNVLTHRLTFLKTH